MVEYEQFSGSLRYKSAPTRAIYSYLCTNLLERGESRILSDSIVADDDDSGYGSILFDSSLEIKEIKKYIEIYIFLES
jgi:hypothetical protein